MQYSPKLKKAAEEIKEILKRYDIAGVVALHTPGFGEYIMDLSPSYSAVTPVLHGYRLRAVASDYNGDTVKRDQMITDTANMLNLLAEMLGLTFSNVDEMSIQVDKITEADHTKGGHSSHTEQNN